MALNRERLDEMVNKLVYVFAVVKVINVLVFSPFLTKQCVMSTEAGKTKVLFVKNLSFNLTKESLAEAFDGATTARIATFPDTGKPRG